MSDYTKIKGMLVYVQIDKPVKGYQKPGAEPKPDEYKASVVITDEDWVDEFEAWLAKVDAKASIKKVKTAEFESIYKVAPPEDAAKNLWVLTFRKSSEQGKTGKKILSQHEPKAYERIGQTLKDITHTKLIANGSYGVIGLEHWVRSNGSISISISKILVLDMIEYVKEDRPEVDVNDEFAEFLEDAKSEPKKSTPAKASTKPVAKSKPKAEDFDDDDDIPF